MSTGENEQALRKIIDFTRMGSILILAILFYISCYGAFESWQLTFSLTDRIMISISHLELFKSGILTKLLVLLLLAISLVGTKGKKDEKMNKKVIAIYISSGIAIFFLSELILLISADYLMIAVCYMLFTSLGYVLTLTGGTWLSRLIKLNMLDDVFNNLAETFEQEERLLENEYSFNFKAKYNLKGKIRNSWVNIINPFRAILIYGTAGSGKSAFVVRHIITQSIKKGYCMLLYDYKIPDLSLIAYNCLLKNKHVYEHEPSFHCIDFDNLNKSNQSNPLIPEAMTDITDASESSRTIMIGLNRDWAKKKWGLLCRIAN